MAGDAPDPLTPEEAKARLRAAAERASPLGWIQAHPWQAAGLALLAGFGVARLGALALSPAVRGRLLGAAVLAAPGLLRGLRPPPPPS